MVQALLMGLLALLNGIQGPYHWYFFREPVMAGFWVGLIYGDPVQGTIIGATINVSYMGWISAGGANASDLYWAGLLGTFVAIQGGMSIDTSVAFAVPIGLLGNYVHVAYMTIASLWPVKMDALAAKGNWRGIRRIQFLGGPAIVLVLRALPVFLIALYSDTDQQYSDMGNERSGCSRQDASGIRYVHADEVHVQKSAAAFLRAGLRYRGLLRYDRSAAVCTGWCMSGSYPD